MARPARSPLRAILISVLAGVALWLWVDQRMSVRLVSPKVAPEASVLRLRDIEGGAHSLADYRGRVVLLNLWASWCGPCRTEIPRLSRLHRELGSVGLVVLGVNLETLPPSSLGPLARELGIDYPVLVPAQELAGSFATEGAIPRTWLIDRRGLVRASHTGLATERSLRRACRTLLAEPTGPS